LTAVQSFILVAVVYPMAQFNGGFLMYCLVVYTLSMVTAAQATVCSCLAGANTNVAMQMTPLLFIPQVLFAGFFVSPHLMPAWLRWIQYVCSTTYAIRILALEEFTKCEGGPLAFKNCDALLESLDADPDETWWYWLMLLVLMVVSRIVALIVLVKYSTSYY